MSIRVAILDMYDGSENLGMTGIIRCVERFPEMQYEIFDVRAQGQIPGLDHDIYIFSGGPGDPRKEEKLWGPAFHRLLDDLWKFNHTQPKQAKQVFNICHSFQMICLHFGISRVIRRRSESFGVYPVHKTDEGERDPIFKELDDPFYAADFRKYQCIQPDHATIARMGARIIAIEKYRPHVQLERALMAIRLSPDWLAVQFHPEAHVAGMLEHFYKRAVKKKIIDIRGRDKYSKMIEDLGDENKLQKTQSIVLPGFLAGAREKILSRRGAFVT